MPDHGLGHYYYAYGSILAEHCHLKVDEIQKTLKQTVMNDSRIYSTKHCWCFVTYSIRSQQVVIHPKPHFKTMLLNENSRTQAVSLVLKSSLCIKNKVIHCQTYLWKLSQISWKYLFLKISNNHKSVNTCNFIILTRIHWTKFSVKQKNPVRVNKTPLTVFYHFT